MQAHVRALLGLFSVLLFASFADADRIRTATFNCSLNRQQAGQLAEDLSGGRDPQAKAVAEIIQRVRPDVLLLNEFDFDPQADSIRLFQEQYLAVSQADQPPVSYPYFYTAPVNTGVASGADLNRDGRIEGAEDAFGFGQFPGQYGMVLLSKFPIRKKNIRTFQRFLWKDLPDAMLPDDASTEAPADWYTPEALMRFRLSSKSHWDIPVDIHGTIIHFLAAHPTPPVFDGSEDRNGRRNHDEICFWTDYLTPDKGRVIYDDQNHFGGLPPEAHFVILGDMNSDPRDGDGLHDAIAAILKHPRVQETRPASKGAEEAAQQGSVNAGHTGPAQLDTYLAPPGRAPGNLRLDYVLPSRSLAVIKTGVFWPETIDPLSRLTAGPPYVSSDHRMVYVDLEIPK